MLLTAPVGFICQSALNVKVLRDGQIYIEDRGYTNREM